MEQQRAGNAPNGTSRSAAAEAQSNLISMLLAGRILASHNF